MLLRQEVDWTLVLGQDRTRRCLPTVAAELLNVAGPDAGGKMTRRTGLWVRSTPESVQRRSLLTWRVSWIGIGLYMESGHSNGHISKLASEVLTGRVRSHIDWCIWSPRKLLSWNVAIKFWIEVYKHFSYSSNLALLLIFSAEKHLWSARECKSLVGWLRFENPRLRTSLVHRE
jgi:hypothetical protein